MECIFCKIVNKEIESFPIYEDQNLLVVLDINPASKGHCLIISKSHENIPKNLGEILEKITGSFKEKLKMKAYSLIKKWEVEHFVLNYIPVYEGKEVVYQINNKKTEEDIKKIADELKIKDNKVIEKKNEKKIIDKDKKTILESKKTWIIKP